MFRIGERHLRAFRARALKQVPDALMARLEKEGLSAQRDEATGDILASDRRGYVTRIQLQGGLPASITSPTGAQHRFEYDDEGREVALIYPDGERLETTYDAHGHVRSLSRPGLLEYSFRHRRDGQLTSVRYPDGALAELTYDKAGLLASYIDRSGAVTRMRRRADGHLIALNDALGREVLSELTDEGAITGLLVPNGERYSYETNREGTSVLVQYGDTRTQHDLDPQGRVIATTFEGIAAGAAPPVLQASFQHDAGGRLAVARTTYGDAEDSLCTWAYGEEGDLPIKESSNGASIAYKYDADGRLVGLTTPFGDEIHYEYDAEGRLARVRDWDGRDIVFAHDLTGRVREVRRGSLVQQIEYGRVGRRSRAVLRNAGGATLCEEQYTYDVCERLTSVVELWGPTAGERRARAFKHDAEGRLLEELDPETGARLTQYEYNAKGLMVRDGSHRVVLGKLDEPMRRDLFELAYDARGNATRVLGRSGSILECTFDAANRLREARNANVYVQFKYDAFGRRIEKSDGTTTVRFGWSGRQLLWEERTSGSGSPVRRDYLIAPGHDAPLAFREGGQTYWLLADARGAVHRAVDSNGQIAWRGELDSFGLLSASAGRVRQPFRLVGQYEDEETGLHYNYARYYSPILKSYLSIDTAWDEPFGARYAYAANAPWDFVDPYGEKASLFTTAMGLLSLALPVPAFIVRAFQPSLGPRNGTPPKPPTSVRSTPLPPVVESTRESVSRATACTRCACGPSTPQLAPSRSNAKAPNFQVTKGQVTFDAEGREGGRWHSRRAHYPGSSSGVTMGRGYDMKYRTEKSVKDDLIAADVAPDIAAMLAKGATLTGDKAKAFANRPEIKALEISAKQQKRLFERVYVEYERRVRSVFGKRAPNLDKIDPRMHEMLVDLCYRGDLGKTGVKNLLPYVQTNDYAGFVRMLSDASKWPNVLKRAPDRFKARIKFLEQTPDPKCLVEPMESFEPLRLP
jgi:RHS repeat-associated protein